MMLVQTTLEKSPIHGLGIFAAEDIPKGTVVWRFYDGFDFYIPESDFRKMPKIAQVFMHRYCYLEQNLKQYVLMGDNARFMNHSATPNTEERVAPGSRETDTVAAVDIKNGEEITCDYRTFDAESDGYKLLHHESNNSLNVEGLLNQ